MTITLQAVNELIQSLESAGELSIKEREYLELGKAYLDVTAENVALKSFGDTLHEIKSSLVGGGHGHMAKADMQAQSAVMDVIFDAFDAIETPTTDAYLAEIKSHDLNAFISHYSAELDEHIANGGDQFDATSIRLRGFIVGGRMFREKLRAGADK
ncbi:hypothetical protein [Klebsiella oxytoca]|uniref:hypothetical protein n=1 Tax=Klebsiella oxytoca TaxID=571 RepID=UPI003981E89D